MKNLQKFILSVVLAVGFWQLLSWRVQSLDTPTPSPYVKYTRHATVDIVDIKRFNEVEFKEGDSAVDVTRKVAEVTLKGTGPNQTVISVNGKAANVAKKEVWSLAVNGKVQNVDYKVQAGDVVAWTIKTK